MSEVIERTLEVARPLRVLVPLIQEEIKQGEKAGVEHYRQAGEYLLEARFQLKPTGEWKSWLKSNFTLSSETARAYMKLAELSNGAERFRTIGAAAYPNRPKAHANHGQWHDPVRKIASKVNVEALRQDQLNRQQEQTLMRQLAIQLIDIGYRVLSSKLHPDKRGGSAEGMARLNLVRKRLKEVF